MNDSDDPQSPDTLSSSDEPSSTSTLPQLPTQRPIRERIAAALLFVGLACAGATMLRNAPRAHPITIVLEGDRKGIDEVDVEVFASEGDGELVHRISKHFERVADPTLTFEVRTAERAVEVEVKLRSDGRIDQTRRRIVLHEDDLGSRVVVRASARGSDESSTSH